MTTGVQHIWTSKLRDNQARTDSDRPCVVLLEDNPLTSWAIDQALAPQFDLMHCTTLSEAERELASAEDCLIVVGSPIADDHPADVAQLADSAPDRVIALVSDPDNPLLLKLPRVLEKPFDLMQLIDLLKSALRAKPKLQKDVIHVNSDNAKNPTSQPTGNRPLEIRLRERFEREVCPVCVHKTADSGCTVTNRVDRFECPVFEWADKIAELARDIDSPRLDDYITQIQSIICPDCRQAADGRCKDRDHLDCPVDLYLGLIIPIIEEELKAERSK